MMREDFETKDISPTSSSADQPDKKEIIQSIGLSLTKELSTFMNDHQLVEPRSVLQTLGLALHEVAQKDFPLFLEWSKDDVEKDIESVATAIGKGIVSFMNTTSIDMAESLVAILQKSLEDLGQLNDLKKTGIFHKISSYEKEIEAAIIGSKLGQDFTELLENSSKEIVNLMKELGKDGAQLYEKIEVLFDNAIEQIGDVAKKILSRAFYAISLFQATMEDIEQAIKSGMKALDMNPDDFEIYDALYSFLVKSKHFQQAEKILKQFKEKMEANAFTGVAIELIEGFYATGLIIQEQIKLKFPKIENAKIEDMEEFISKEMSEHVQDIAEGAAYIIDTAVDGTQTIKEKFAKQGVMLMKMHEVLAQQGIKLNDVEEAVEHLKVKIDEIEDYLQTASIIKISQLNSAYKELSEQSHKDYCRLFHWALFSYFTGMHCLSSGLIERNLNHSAKDKLVVSVVEKALGYATKATNGIPIVAGVLNIVHDAFDSMAEYAKHRIVQGKIQNCTKIIKHFEDKKSLEIFTKRLALYMLESRKNIMEVEQDDISHKGMLAIKEKAIAFGKSLLNKISEQYKASPLSVLQDPKSEAEKSALDDVIKCISVLHKSANAEEFFEKVAQGEDPGKALIGIVLRESWEHAGEIAGVMIEQIADIVVDEPSMSVAPVESSPQIKQGGMSKNLLNSIIAGKELKPVGEVAGAAEHTDA